MTEKDKIQPNALAKAIKGLVKANRLTILVLLDKKGEMTLTLLANETGIKKQTLEYHLEELLKEGLIESRMEIISSKAIRLLKTAPKYQAVREQLLKDLTNHLIGKEGDKK